MANQLALAYLNEWRDYYGNGSHGKKFIPGLVTMAMGARVVSKDTDLW